MSSLVANEPVAPQGARPQRAVTGLVVRRRFAAVPESHFRSLRMWRIVAQRYMLGIPVSFRAASQDWLAITDTLPVVEVAAQRQLVLEYHFAAVEYEELPKVRVTVRYDVHQVQLRVIRVTIVRFENRFHRSPVEQVPALTQGDMPLPGMSPSTAQVCMLVRSRSGDKALARRIYRQAVTVTVER